MTRPERTAEASAAAAAAQRKDMTVIALTGRTGGALRLALGETDVLVAVPHERAARVAEPGPAGWTVNQWLKKAVLLSFRLNPMAAISGGPGGAQWWDKVDSKFVGWGPEQFGAAGFRAVPGAIVRRGAFIAPGAVLMPSFVNIGARVGEVEHDEFHRASGRHHHPALPAGLHAFKDFVFDLQVPAEVVLAALQHRACGGGGVAAAFHLDGVEVRPQRLVVVGVQRRKQEVAGLEFDIAVWPRADRPVVVRRLA